MCNLLAPDNHCHPPKLFYCCSDGVAAVLANRQQLNRRETCKGFVRKIGMMVVVC